MDYNIIINILKMIDKIFDAVWSLLEPKLVALGLDFGQILILAILISFYIWGFRPLSKKVGEIKNNFDDLHNATWEMQHHLGNKKGKLLPVHKLDKLTWANANSPFVLNPKGKNLSEKSGIEKIVNDNIEKLVELVGKSNPVSGYDVEKCSFSVLSDFVQSNPITEKQIKDFVFNNPVFEGKEIGLDDIFFVGSIQIREAYFKNHPEIKEEKTD